MSFKDVIKLKNKIKIEEISENKFKIEKSSNEAKKKNKTSLNKLNIENSLDSKTNSNDIININRNIAF